VSLRLRLLVAVAVVALVALALAGLATYSTFSASINQRLDATLRAAAIPVEACLDDGGRLTASLLVETSPGIVGEVRTPSGRILAEVAAVTPPRGVPATRYRPDLPGRVPSLDGLPESRPGAGEPSDDCVGARRPGQQGARAGGTRQRAARARPAERPRAVTLGVARYFTTGGDGTAEPSFRVRASRLAGGNVLVLAVPFSQSADLLRRLGLIEIGVSAAALVLALGLGLLLVRVGFRPLLEVERTAAEIVAGDLDARVPERFGAQTEIGQLTRVLNSMLERLGEELQARDASARELGRSEARMRQFLADVSHELRTPIAAISAYAELLSRASSDRPQDLPRLLGGIRHETARMSTLVQDLTLLANLDEGRPLARRPVELVALCADALRAARAIGAGWPIELVATEPVEVEGDETRLRQVVDNLLANVRSHTPAGTAATLRVARRAGWALVEVADHGPGLGPEAKERVFERFFRGDSSRSRGSGGSGLGLAIVRAIVLAHGGEVAVSATEGGGATFTVRLPEYQPQPG
jgi:two-component system OmpR family sensor kinase